jgi:phage terminase Nu1 subunit (DNA packaging protein)
VCSTLERHSKGKRTARRRRTVMNRLRKENRKVNETETDEEYEIKRKVHEIWHLVSVAKAVHSRLKILQLTNCRQNHCLSKSCDCKHRKR